MFILDTNVASELRRPEPSPSVTAWIEERDARDMYLTAVSEAEGECHGYGYHEMVHAHIATGEKP